MVRIRRPFNIKGEYKRGGLLRQRKEEGKNVSPRFLFFIVFLTVVFEYSTASATSFFENILPAWPISSVGEEIPSSLIDGWRMLGDTCRIPGTVNYFPSKGRRPTDDSTLTDAEKLEKKFDPQSFNCDDGDMTMFNGLLCASGEKSGCAAVQSAQDPSGRFYRSPHQKGVWEVRCYDK